jgi:hypothetical protein
MDYSSFKNNVTAKKWVLGVLIIFMVFCVMRIWFVSDFLRFIEKSIIGMTHDQEIKSKNFHDEANSEAEEIQKHMSDGAMAMSKNANNLDKELENFGKDFSESIDKAKKEFDKNWHDPSKDEYAEVVIKSANEMERNDKDWEKSMEKKQLKEEALETRKINAKCVTRSKPLIPCEKKIFGSVTYNPKNPCAYNPFPWGMPDSLKNDVTCKKIT